MNPKLLSVLTFLNLIVAASISWWIFGKNSYEIASLENALEKLSEKKPHFLVSLLNKSANAIAKNEESNMEQQAFQNREKLLSAGFCVKKYSDVHLVIFADMTDANSLSYLENVKSALATLNCSVYIIPIAIFGKKSSEQAELIWAASLQDCQKALQLALIYNPIEDIENNQVKEAVKLGLDAQKLASDRNDQKTHKEIVDKTQLAESLGISAPTIFLLNDKETHILPPVEAKDLPALIENPTLSLVE